MNYTNHHLRTNLQEWLNRIYRADTRQFPHQLKYLFDNLENNSQLKGLLDELIIKYPYSEEQLAKISSEKRGVRKMNYSNLAEQASFSFQFMKYVFKENNGRYDINSLAFFRMMYSGDMETKIVENFIVQIINHLHDQLDESNSTIYLLERYKKRTEWFTKDSLMSDYKIASKNYEQIFEDDLRLFLFDQGVEYPFSTPSSSSGRSDIVGELETKNPLIIEIKIIDNEKNYGINRIKEGFSQIVKYANDFNKDVGYLVLFILDDSEINFDFKVKTNIFPPSLQFNNKLFYFIPVRINNIVKASKSKKVRELTINEVEITEKL